MSEKIDAVRLTFYTAPLTCIVLLPFYWSLEHKKYAEYQQSHTAGYAGRKFFILLEMLKSLVLNIFGVPHDPT